MRPKAMLYIVVIASVLIWASCATTSRLTNLSPAYLYLTPSVSSYQDPESDLSRYRTFSVFPLSLISSASKMNEIMEKQLLFFFLRNQLEAKGYRFVQLDETPDFLATINLSSEYHQTYVPPQTTVLPQWIPGRTISTYDSTSGTFNFSTYGGYSSYGWGNYSGQTTSTTYIPGYMTTQTYTRRGYTVGHYYPVAAVWVYDAKTLRNVWLGTGGGTSDNADARISGQFVVAHILGKYPNHPGPELTDKPPKGVVGIRCGIFTNDGNAYFPTILSLPDGSPAKKAGAEPYDMILSVDGVPVVNKSFSEVAPLLAGEPGTRTKLEIWRIGQRLNIEIIRVDRSDVRW